MYSPGSASSPGTWAYWSHQARHEVVEVLVRELRELEESKPSALARAPRAVRMEAAAYLEPLALAITERMKSYISSISEAKKLAKQTDANPPPLPADATWHVAGGRFRLLRPHPGALPRGYSCPSLCRFGCLAMLASTNSWPIHSASTSGRTGTHVPTSWSCARSATSLAV